MHIWTPKIAFAIVVVYYIGFAVYGLIRDLRSNKDKLVPLVDGGKLRLSPTFCWLFMQWVIPTAVVVAGAVLALIAAISSQDCPRYESHCELPDFWPTAYEFFWSSVIGIQALWTVLVAGYGIIQGFSWMAKKTSSQRARAVEAISSGARCAWERFPLRW